MNGLELARAYYEAYGAPMLRERFPELLPVIAVGLCGSGSECWGYDDLVSRDHDFEPGFCLFLPDEDTVDRRTAFLLERAYAALPKAFEGFIRSRINPVGGGRHGVIRRADFFRDRCGSPDGALTVEGWLTTPEELLAEALNGEVFFDGDGAFTRIRARLADMPEDVRRKKLAGRLILMKQAGIYNYPRILAHGEAGAAQLAIHAFADAAMRAVFLLNRRPMPYYKWSFRAMRELPFGGNLAEAVEFLLLSDNEPETAKTKEAVLADIGALIVGEVVRQGLSDAEGDDPEVHGYAVNGGIADPALRNRHVLAAV